MFEKGESFASTPLFYLTFSFPPFLLMLLFRARTFELVGEVASDEK